MIGVNLKHQNTKQNQNFNYCKHLEICKWLIENENDLFDVYIKNGNEYWDAKDFTDYE